MPKEEKNKNVEAPAEFTPAAPAVNQDAAENVTAASPRSRRLGTGAIVGLSAAGVALLAGVFGSGVAIANGLGEGASHQQQSGQVHVDMDGDHMAGGQQGQMNGERAGGQQGQQPGGKHGAGQQGQMRGDADGPMDGMTPHEHDANGNDIVPDAATTPDATTTN